MYCKFCVIVKENSAAVCSKQIKFELNQINALVFTVRTLNIVSTHLFGTLFRGIFQYLIPA